MRIKLLAVGNLLMEDDGIAIYLAEQLRYDLLQMGIEVIIGETDLGYLLSNITGEDYLILLDAASCLPCGSIACFPFREEKLYLLDGFQHDISILSLCRCCYPRISGIIIGIGIGSLGFHYGLSPQLSSRFSILCKDLIELIQMQLRTGKLRT
jgi:hydrogenase maturation protease